METDAQTGPRLVVASGRHAGASSPLPVGDTRVGAALETDIGVSDLSAPVAFIVRRSGDAVTIEAADAEVSVGGRLLRRGRARTCRTTTALSSGGVAFDLRIPGRERLPAPAPRRWRATTGAFMAGAACAAVLTLAVSLHAAPFPTLPGWTATGGDVAGALPAPAEPAAPAPKPDVSGAAMLGGLRRQVAAAGIETLDLRLQPDGAIAAAGTLAPAQERAWHDIGRWFDTEARGHVVLIDDVRVADATPVLQIQAVWPGRNPYVVDGGGQKLFVGATLASGWIIRSIDKSRVLIRRGEQVVAVRF